MTEDDLPLLQRWLNNPDVATWYGTLIDHVSVPRPELAQVAAQYGPLIHGEEPTAPYIIVMGGESIGYIQAYRIGDHPEYAAAIDVHDDDVGIDLLIGEDAYRGRGLGAGILRSFLAAEVFRSPDTGCAVIAPNPANVRAIRCYAKAGFRHLKTVLVPIENEHEYVMTITRAEFDGRLKRKASR